VQNVGAYGSDIAQVMVSVRVYDRHSGEQYTVDAPDCEFDYRDSRFKRDPQRWLILDVTVRLRQSELSMPIAYTELANELGVHVGEQARLVHVRRAVLHLRRGKGMVLDLDDHDSWSAGSFFTNPIVAHDVADQLPSDAPRWPLSDGRVKLSAGWLIEHAGFSKGWSTSAQAPAGLSFKHPLALTNRGGASCADIVDLARAVRDGVSRQFGVVLVPEPTLVGCRL
jgi:UDP-N-acetylmuramate dehydrogenase